jgi:hypothetical protein
VTAARADHEEVGLFHLDPAAPGLGPPAQEVAWRLATSHVSPDRRVGTPGATPQHRKQVPGEHRQGRRLLAGVPCRACREIRHAVAHVMSRLALREAGPQASLAIADAPVVAEVQIPHDAGGPAMQDRRDLIHSVPSEPRLERQDVAPAVPAIGPGLGLDAGSREVPLAPCAGAVLAAGATGQAECRILGKRGAYPLEVRRGQRHIRIELGHELRPARGGRQTRLQGEQVPSLSPPEPERSWCGRERHQLDPIRAGCELRRSSRCPIRGPIVHDDPLRRSHRLAEDGCRQPRQRALLVSRGRYK